ATTVIQWESATPGVKFEPATSRVLVLGPGESAAVPLTVTSLDRSLGMLSIIAAEGANRMPIEVPLFPPAEPLKDIQIVDGRTVRVFLHGLDSNQATFGEGNADGRAAPGERFAVLLPDGDDWRLAELFTNDPCVDNTMRASDSWAQYDHSGASARYSLPMIRKECTPGHVIH